MLQFGRVKKLLQPIIPDWLRIHDSTEVCITSAESLFGIALVLDGYECSIFTRRNGYTGAWALTERGWETLPIHDRIETATSRLSEQEADYEPPSVGELLLERGVRKVFLLLLKEEEGETDGGWTETLTVGIGPKSLGRYMIWRAFETARQIERAIKGINSESLCPQPPTSTPRRSRRRVPAREQA